MVCAGFKIGDGGGGPETPGEFGELVGPFVGCAGFHGFFDGEPDFGFLVGGAEADGFEGIFIGDVDLGGEGDEDVFCFFGGEVAEGEGDVAADGGVGVFGHFSGEGEDVGVGTAEGAVGGETDLGVVAFEEFYGLFKASVSKVREEPDAASGDPFVGMREEVDDGGEGFFAHFFEGGEA